MTRIEMGRMITECADNYGYELRDDYSGRGMYGRECIAVVTGDVRCFWSDMKQYLIETLEDQDAYMDYDCEEIEEEAGYILEDVQHAAYMDNMGYDYVIYWPYIQIEDLEEDEPEDEAEKELDATAEKGYVEDLEDEDEDEDQEGEDPSSPSPQPTTRPVEMTTTEYMAKLSNYTPSEIAYKLFGNIGEPSIQTDTVWLTITLQENEYPQLYNSVRNSQEDPEAWRPVLERIMDSIATAEYDDMYETPEGDEYTFICFINETSIDLQKRYIVNH